MKERVKKITSILALIVLILTTTNVISIAEYIGEEIVNYGVILKMKSEEESVETGKTHKITLKTSYANPNDKDDSTIKVHLTDADGNPNTKAELLGLIDNKMIFECQNATEASVTLELKSEYDDDNNLIDRYLEYILPPGTSAEMELEFLVPNGISKPEETLILTPEVSHKLTEGTNDKIDQSLTVKWTSEFNWSNLVKNSNIETIKINNDNRLSKNIEYSFTANNNSGETGSIYTNSIKISDTLTLPEAIALPENITYSGNKIYANDELLYVINIDEKYTESYKINTLEAKDKTIKFELIVSNPNINDGKLTQDFNPLSNIKAVLYADKLVISEDYVSVGVDKITNNVETKMYPAVEGITEITLNANKDITIEEDKEDITFTKAIDKPIVSSTDNEVRYTITMRNNGRTQITKKFEDIMPEEIQLTQETIDDLKNKGYKVNDGAPYNITKEIQLQPEEEITLQISASIDTSSLKTITNTASLGNLTSSAAVRVKEKEEIKLNKEIAARYDYNGSDYDIIRDGDRLNTIGEGDVIEYTVTLTNDTNEEKEIALRDFTPMANSASSCTSIGYVGNYCGTTMKYMTADDEEASNLPKLYNYNDFTNNLVSKSGYPYVMTLTVKIPANTEYKQTFLLTVPKSVESGEQYEFSYDAYLDAIRFNSGYARGTEDTQTYTIPYNYIEISGTDISSIVYHEVERRYNVQKGVLGINAYDDIQSGNAIGNAYSKDLNKYDVSRDTVVTYYAYFLNDSVYDLDMSTTNIYDILPNGFEFLGFNIIKESKDSKYPLPKISSCLDIVTNNVNSFEYSAIWANDSRAINNPQQTNASFPTNRYFENETIIWELSNKYDVYENDLKRQRLDIKASGTLKPGQGCYVLYSCRVNPNKVITDKTQDKKYNTNYIYWNTKDYSKMNKSNSYDVSNFIKAYNKDNSNYNDGICNRRYDYELGSSVYIEPKTEKKSAKIEKKAYFAYDKGNTNKQGAYYESEDGNSIVWNSSDGEELQDVSGITGRYFSTIDGIHSVTDYRNSVIWKVTITNDGESTINVPKLYEIIDKPFNLYNITYKIKDENGTSKIEGQGQITSATTKVEYQSNVTGEYVIRNLYVVNFRNAFYDMQPGESMDVYFFTQMSEEKLDYFYDTTILPIDQQYKENYWELKTDQADSLVNGYSGIKSDDWVSNIGTDGTKYIAKGETDEVNSKNNTVSYIVDPSKKDTIDFTLKMESHLYQTKNYKEGSIKNIKFYDLLPGVNGGVDTEDVGGGYSIDTDSFTAYILRTDGTKEEIEKDNFTVEYSLESLHTNRHYESVSTAKDTTYNVDFTKAEDDSIWQNEYTEDMRSFRVIFNESIELKDADMIFVKYTAKVRENLGNTEKYSNIFGYKYDVVVEQDPTLNKTLIADTSDVTVKLGENNDAYITKKVVDKEGNEISQSEIETMAPEGFTFSIYSIDENKYENKNANGTLLGEFKVKAGETKTLKQIAEEQQITIKNGGYYYITESNLAGFRYKDLNIETEDLNNAYIYDSKAFIKYVQDGMRITFQNEINNAGTMAIRKIDENGNNVAFRNSSMTFKVLDKNKNEVKFIRVNDTNFYEFVKESENATSEIETTSSDTYLRDLPLGTYYIQEVKAPNNYELNPELQEVQLTQENKSKTVNITDNSIQKTGTLNVAKVDKDTQEIITEETVFKINDKNSKTMNFVDLKTQDEKGNHYRLATVEDTETTQDLKTYKGKIQITGLEFLQNYYLKETKAPWGYKLDTTPNRIYIYGTSPEESITINNTKNVNNIIINKEDYGGNLLTNGVAKFEVYDNKGNKLNFEKLENTEDSSIYKSIANTTETSTTVIETYNGKIKLQEIPVGYAYTLKEIEAPEGYIVNSKETKMQIVQNKEYEYTVKNGKNAGTVNIVKTDLNGDIINSNTVVFKLYKKIEQTAEDNQQEEKKGEAIKLAYANVTENGRQYYMSENDIENKHSRIITSEGKITITNLPIGKYYLEEVVAPTGYMLMEEKIEFEVKEDSYLNPVNVNVKDPAYKFGQENYMSSSYQKIEEKDKETNCGYSYYGKDTDYENGNYNYIVVDAKEDIVTYTLRVANMSKKNFEKVVLINKLPQLNDTGTVNLDEKRDSEFTVKLAENPNFKLVMYDENGEEIEISKDEYKIEYSDATTYTNNDWDGKEDNAKWYSNPTENTESFRIVFTEDFVLPSKYNIAIKFDGEIQENAVPGKIAWNSFGYRYYIGSIQLTPEPPKVGVKIPYEPEISKITTDNREGTYKFEVYENGKDKVAEISVKSGETATLEAKRTVNNITSGYLESGKTYTVKEKNTKGTILLNVTGTNGNIKENEFEFTYNPETKINATFTNMPRNEAEVMLIKTDQETKEPLKDAEFKMLDKDGNTIKVTETEGRYVIDTENGNETMKTNEEGQIILINMPYGEYALTETKAPEGYVTDTTTLHRFIIDDNDYEETEGNIVNITEIVEVTNVKQKVPEKEDPNDNIPTENKEQEKNDETNIINKIVKTGDGIPFMIVVTILLAIITYVIQLRIVKNSKKGREE